jgi:hypothetical protein
MSVVNGTRFDHKTRTFKENARMAAKELHLNIKVWDGGSPIFATMKGFTYIEAGFLFGHLIDGGLLSESQRVLTTAFTFTGCPIAARADREEWNPWHDTRGAYTGRRMLHGPGFNVHSTLKAVPRANGIEAELELEIHGEMPQVIGVAKPFQEIIVQTARGQLAGDFSLQFVTAGGKVIDSSASTIYDLQIARDVIPVWRNITILAECHAGTLTQVEQIDLFISQDEAAADLADKARAFGSPLQVA